MTRRLNVMLYLSLSDDDMNDAQLSPIIYVYLYTVVSTSSRACVAKVSFSCCLHVRFQIKVERIGTQFRTPARIAVSGSSCKQQSGKRLRHHGGGSAAPPILGQDGKFQSLRTPWVFQVYMWRSISFLQRSINDYFRTESSPRRQFRL
jgi:hypothetical protein